MTDTPQPPFTLPWDYIKSTEHHGPYVVSAYGCIIADFYCMSRPDDWSVRNGGTSKPIHHMGELADEHAAYAVRASNAHEALVGALRRLDAFWREDFPEGPDGDPKCKTGLAAALGARLSENTLEIWREIRAAIALADEVPFDARPSKQEARDWVVVSEYGDYFRAVGKGLTESLKEAGEYTMPEALDIEGRTSAKAHPRSKFAGVR
jgi:hypothetical protein